jgi:hypothetical protein
MLYVTIIDPWSDPGFIIGAGVRASAFFICFKKVGQQWDKIAFQQQLKKGLQSIQTLQTLAITGA